jgi:hypothetical protein
MKSALFYKIKKLKIIILLISLFLIKIKKLKIIILLIFLFLIKIKKLKTLLFNIYILNNNGFFNKELYNLSWFQH